VHALLAWMSRSKRRANLHALKPFVLLRYSMQKAGSKVSEPDVVYAQMA